MKKYQRLTNEVNAGSMADIAFLLLIFFLVTTTIEVEKGISIKLPPINTDEPITPPGKNVLSIKLNAEDALLVEGKEIKLENLRSETKIFISNPEKLKSLPTLPKNAIISLQHDRSTSYNSYIEVYNELKAAYNELWEAEAQRLYGKSFKALADVQVVEVRKIIPFVISEAEPVDYASAGL